MIRIRCIVMTLAVLVSASAVRAAPEGEGGPERPERGPERQSRPVMLEPGRRGGERGEPSVRHGQLMERLLTDPQLTKKLGLSEDQLKTMRDELFEIRTAEIDLRAELEKAGMQQARLMMDEDVDTEAVMQAIERTGEVRTEMAKLRMRPLLLMKEVLTPEQRKQARELMRRHMENRRGREQEDRRRPGDMRRENRRERRPAPERERDKKD